MVGGDAGAVNSRVQLALTTDSKSCLGVLVIDDRQTVLDSRTKLCEELGSGYGHFFFERAIDTYGPVAGDGTL